MKTSKYTIIFPYKNDKYIYNTLSTAIAKVNENIINALKINDFSSIQHSFIENLIENHFIVEDSINESDEYFYFYDSTRFNASARSFYVNLIPSYNCNLACKYCYEGQEKNNSIMDMNSLDIIIKFYKNHIINSNGLINKSIIRFYGGEPLLNKKHLIKFAMETKKISNELQVPVRYDMASNFTLVDEDILKLIRDYDVSIQVTIDGDKQTHDKRRISKSGSGTYDLIIRNLEKACKFGIKNNITIRINIDEGNIGQAEDALKSVSDYSNYVYFGLLNEFKGYNDTYSKQCIELKQYSTVLTNTLNPLLKKYGFAMLVPFGKHSPCALVSENKFFIDDKRRVYKCEIIVNRDDTSVGFIDDNGYFIPNMNYYHQMSVSPKNYEKCRQCELLPLCAGGCAAKKYISSRKHDGIFDECFCEFTRNSLIEYLKFYIDNPEE